MTETTEPKPVRLSVTNGQDLMFNGRILHEYTTQNRERTKSRWTDLRLYETAGGNWVAVSIGATENDREVDLLAALVIDEDAVDRHKRSLEAFHGDQEDFDSVRREIVMEFFGWTTAAKAFAREARWNVIRKVD